MFKKWFFKKKKDNYGLVRFFCEVCEKFKLDSSEFYFIYIVG